MVKKEQIEMQEVLKFAVEMGRVLLKNGAEIFRVEETIAHVCHYYNIEGVHSFILSNGIFVTAENEGEEVFARVQHVPLSAPHFGIVDGVNNLSREICEGKISFADAKVKLESIAVRPAKKSYFRIIAAALGSACFCYLVDATVVDCFKTFGIGILLNIFVIFCERHRLSKMIVNTVGGGIVTVLALCICREGGEIVNASLDKVIIGSIFSLVPGFAFVNSIRDIANSDILSGVVKMIDALLGFVYIAIGVGTILSIYGGMFGGINI